MKKLYKLSLGLLLAMTMVGCQTSEEVTDTKSEEEISIHFTIVDETKEEPVTLFDDEVSVSKDSKTLEDVLVSAEELKLVSTDSQYGLVILGLMGVEGDWDKGPWWLYESTTNASCVEAGYCAGASDLEVSDGDVFTFKLTSETY